MNFRSDAGVCCLANKFQLEPVEVECDGEDPCCAITGLEWREGTNPEPCCEEQRDGIVGWGRNEEDERDVTIEGDCGGWVRGGDDILGGVSSDGSWNSGLMNGPFARRFCSLAARISYICCYLE